MLPWMLCTAMCAPMWRRHWAPLYIGVWRVTHGWPGWLGRWRAKGPVMRGGHRFFLEGFEPLRFRARFRIAAL